MVSREPDELFKKFVDDFPSLGLKWRMSDKEWTKKIFDYFAKLGKNDGFEVWYENSPYEYLLDMCWIYATDKPPLNWIEVAFEIEFSRDMDSITDEFSKLVDIKAYTKVLFCIPKVDEIDDLVSSASHMIRYNPLRFPEERYLLLMITETRKRLIANGIVLDSQGNTFVLKPVEFPR
jgi:hypothetical protein